VAAIACIQQEATKSPCSSVRRAWLAYGGSSHVVSPEQQLYAVTSGWLVEIHAVGVVAPRMVVVPTCSTAGSDVPIICPHVLRAVSPNTATGNVALVRVPPGLVNSCSMGVR
jgi:hypothetical protein